MKHLQLYTKLAAEQSNSAGGKSIDRRDFVRRSQVNLDEVGQGDIAADACALALHKSDPCERSFGSVGRATLKTSSLMAAN